MIMSNIGQMESISELLKDASKRTILDKNENKVKSLADNIISNPNSNNFSTNFSNTNFSEDSISKIGLIGEKLDIVV